MRLLPCGLAVTYHKETPDQKEILLHNCTANDIGGQHAKRWQSAQVHLTHTPACLREREHRCITRS
jgi:hypothetical protein